jgi:hypothetical protein
MYEIYWAGSSIEHTNQTANETRSGVQDIDFKIPQQTEMGIQKYSSFL